MIASHCVGSEKNASPIQTDNFSSRVPRRQAATTPVTRPRTIEKNVPSSSIGIVFASGSQSCGSTGWRFSNERPKSPWARFFR